MDDMLCIVDNIYILYVRMLCVRGVSYSINNTKSQYDRDWNCYLIQLRSLCALVSWEAIR